MIYIRTRAQRSSSNPLWTLIDDELSANTLISKRYTVRIESNNGYTLSDQVTSLVLSARLFRSTDGADITVLAKEHGVRPEWTWLAADNTMALSGDAWSVTLFSDNVLRPARMECRIDEAAIDVRLWLNNVLLRLSQQAPQQFGYNRIYARAECDITNDAHLIHSFVLSPDLIPHLLASSKFREAVKGAKGDRGAEGPRGATGATGAKGDKGDQGAKGDKGDTGHTPTLTLDEQFRLLADGALVSSQSIKGAKGDRGAEGPRGATGAKGQDAGRYLGRAKRIHPDFHGNFLLETESSWQTAQEGDYVYLVGDLSNRGGNKDTYYIVREHKSNTVWEPYDIKGNKGQDASPSDVAELIASDAGNLYRAVINRDPINKIGKLNMSLNKNFQRHKVYMLGKSETIKLSTLTNGLPEGARLSIIRELTESPKTQSSTNTTDLVGGGKIIVDTPTIKPPQNPQDGSGGYLGGDIPTYTLNISIDDLHFGAKEHKPRTIEIVMQRVCQTDGSCKVMPVVISDDMKHADLADKIDTEHRRINTERQRINDMQALLRTQYAQRNLISLNNRDTTNIYLNSDISTVIVRRGSGSYTRYLRVEELRDAPIGTIITIYHFSRESNVRAIIPFPSSSYGYAGFISSWGAPDSESVTTQPGYRYELIKTWNPLEFHIARFKMD